MYNKKITSNTLAKEKTLLRVVQINTMQDPIFKNLQMCYECEFSPITKTLMTSKGDYDQLQIATHWSREHDIYLFYINEIPAGFCVVNKQSMIEIGHETTRDIAEFYIVPLYRKCGYGTLFAQEILKLYTGNWEIRQLAELEKTSRQFWLKVIASLAPASFQEIENHSDWHGFVQKFTIRK